MNLTPTPDANQIISQGADAIERLGGLPASVYLGAMVAIGIIFVMLLVALWFRLTNTQVSFYDQLMKQSADMTKRHDALQTKYEEALTRISDLQTQVNDCLNREQAKDERIDAYERMEREYKSLKEHVQNVVGENSKLIERLADVESQLNKLKNYEESESEV